MTTSADPLLTLPTGPVECRVEGPVDGVPVVVLHGTPGGIDAARTMAEFLPRDRFRVITLSRPGYLGTELGDLRTPDQQADLVAAVLDALMIPRAAVMAWSGGGPAAYRFAVRHPDKTVALVAVAAVSQPYRIPTAGLADRLMFGSPVGDWLLRVLAAHQPEKLVSATLASEGDLTPEQLQQRTREVMADDRKRRFVLELSSTVATHGRRRAGYDNDLAQLERLPDLQLESITVPTMIIQGSADADLPPEHSYRAAERIPDARAVVLDTGTHLALWTHPEADATQAQVLEFLTAAGVSS